VTAAGVGVVVAVLVLLAVVSAASAPSAAGRGRGPGGSTPIAHRLRGREVPGAIRRTVAARSARLDVTYTPSTGPVVTITGWTSFVGPEAEVSATVGVGPAASVRVTADGAAWVRVPGAEAWTPVSLDRVTVAAEARGWSDLMRTLRSTDEVWADGQGRIVRVRRAPSLDLRWSDFGAERALAPP
jgi:hypothetical protein